MEQNIEKSTERKIGINKGRIIALSLTAIVAVATIAIMAYALISGKDTGEKVLRGAAVFIINYVMHKKTGKNLLIKSMVCTFGGEKTIG
jgi:hypothetical protein